MFHLIAQTIPNIDGAAGWTSFGIAGLVLSWLLLKHMPDKDRQLKELIDRHDMQMQELLDRHDKAENALSVTFTNALERITQHCKDEMSRMLASLSK